MRLLLAALALLLALPSAAQTRPDLTGSKYGEARAYFKDWLASCRPDGYCSALAYIGADGDLFDASVRVAAPRPGLDKELIFVGPDGAGPAATIVISIDGARIVALEPGADLGWANEPGDSANEFRVSQSAANLTLIPAMRAGRFLDVVWVGPGAPVEARFSLRGLTAALGWIEARRAR